MHVVYVGPGDSVTLAPAAGAIHFPQGEPVEVSEELGRSLIEQATFIARPPEKSRRRRGAASAVNPNVETRGGTSSGTGSESEVSERGTDG